MRYRFFALIIMSSLAFGVSAQSDDENNFEGDYLGLQANELLRQLLNLGNAELPNNPYFFNYTSTSASGGGFNMGLALRIDQFSQQGGFNTLTTEIDNFSIRVGYDKKKALGKRFYYSLGVDFLFDNLVNKTTTEDSFGSQIVRTETKTSGWGFGPRFTLNYRINDRLIIGTEANYYYKSLTEKFETTFEDFPSNNTSEETDISRLNFAAPSILWVTVRL